jgi:hypothetical protein
MPQRFLRPGITNSERWNSVPWKAQSLYVRLLTRVDDFGRHDGRVSVIWSNCFAVWNDLNRDEIVELQQVAQMLQQLSDKKLVEIYESEDKKVLQILQWQERIRVGVKKWWPDKRELQQLSRELQQLSRELQRSPSPSPSPSPPRSNAIRAASPLSSVLERWNKATGLKGCLLLSDKRRRLLQTRLSEKFFADNWQGAIERIEGSNFCKGQNERGWKASFDWFIRADTVIKIIEGVYDNATSKPKPRGRI